MMKRVVFKLGGSLLDRRGLAELIRQLHAQRADCGLLWVVGGGPTADVVRAWDRVHGLGNDVAHWLAIESMGLNESLVQRLCPELRLVRSGPQFETAVQEKVPALCCAACFVRWGEARGFPLAHTWDVTSDSIAAWAAAVVGADELVLVKSASSPDAKTFAEVAQAGLVDPAFPALADGLKSVSWVNGRAEKPEIVVWSRLGSRH